jgi:hypothetical protein
MLGPREMSVPVLSIDATRQVPRPSWRQSLSRLLSLRPAPSQDRRRFPEPPKPSCVYCGDARVVILFTKEEMTEKVCPFHV